MKRTIILIVLAAAMTSTLAACGKKGNLEEVPGSTYPRTYPPPDRMEPRI
jgi:predicted small lipoprotein YifL